MPLGVCSITGTGVGVASGVGVAVGGIGVGVAWGVGVALTTTASASVPSVKPQPGIHSANPSIKAKMPTLFMSIALHKIPFLLIYMIFGKYASKNVSAHLSEEADFYPGIYIFLSFRQ